MTERRRAYMDWNATAPLLAEAREAFLRVSMMEGNASSVHREGRAIRAVIEDARRNVAIATGASAANVVFTSGATEAANFVLSPRYRMGKADIAASRLYVSAVEHKAIFDGGRFSAGEKCILAVDNNGVVDLSALERAMNDHDKATGLALVAIMLANNETGVIQPVREAASIVHDAGGILVVDAVQAFGRVPVDIESLHADYLIVSSHKIGGPKGVGALVCRGEALMPVPLITGGGQEKGHRSGTENAPAIAGFGVAANLASGRLGENVEKMSALRDRLEHEMRLVSPELVIHGSAVERLCNTTFFSLQGLKSETGQIGFDLEGVALSAGSACSSGKVGESHVLKAMGLDPAMGALRISIGHLTTDADIELTLNAFRRIAGRLPRANAA